MKLVTLVRHKDPNREVFVRSIIKNTSHSVIAYITGGEPFVDDPRVEWRRLGDLESVKTFSLKAAFANGLSPQGYDPKKDALGSSYKAFAFADAAQRAVGESYNGWLFWVDCDIEAKAALSLDFDTDIVHLGRKGARFSDTGFIGVKLSDVGCEFLADLFYLYSAGEVFGYADWTFAFVFERLLNLHREHGARVFNLTPEVTAENVLAHSPLAALLVRVNPQEVSVADTTPKPQQIRVIPQNCVADDKLVTNINTNRPRFTKWLKKCQRHSGRAVLVSGGPSAKDFLPEIKASGATVFCVKHSHNMLIEAGIVPYGCVMLDPRPLEGTSTHGIVRKDLLAEPHPEVLYFCATMLDPTVVEHLLAKKANVVGWNAFCNAALQAPIPHGDFYVMGGTCAAMRMIGLAHALGFRTMDLYGYDSCWPDSYEKDFKAVDELGRPKFMQIATSPTGRKWWTTGELLSQAQDIEEFLKRDDYDMDITMHGSGLGSELFEIYKKPISVDFSEWSKSVA